MASSVETSISPSRQTALQEKLAICLALIAGYVDATGLIKWKTYVSFMSGNTTQLGAAISATETGTIITSSTVIGSFILGIYAGTCLSLSKNNRIKTLTIYMVAGILILYTTAANIFTIAAVASVAIIGFAMGLMNTILTVVGSQKVNTDFVTGTLNSLAGNTAMLTMSNNRSDAAQYKSNALHLLLVWFGFMAGAAMAHFAQLYYGNLTLLLPALLLLICSFFKPAN
ncbi:MAG: DUF1275 domain-containing protein [Chitinophagaceae bacterium]|nr:MAG: DUF1275 domain-containing protein [Chitinophagaceae bacterium]